jgi:hypothetical protein
MKRFLLLTLLLNAPGAMAGLLVTDMAGKAQVEGRGSVTTLAEIPDGAQVTLAAGARLVAVDLSSGREYVLKGNAKYVISADGPKTSNGKPVAASTLPARNLPEVKVASAKVAQAAIVMRGIRRFNVPVLHAPAQTTITTTTPLFQWGGVEDSTGYRLILKGSDGTVIWDTPTATTELIVPQERSLPAGERYTWRIEAIGSDGRTISDASASFSVAPSGVIKRLAELKPGPNAPFGRRVLYAAQLREAGALTDAKEQWKILAQERPNDEVLKSLAE